jgi:hypothetical protein
MNRLMRAACVAGSLALFAATSAAQSPEPNAEQIRVAAEEFDDGKRAFKEGEYVTAAEHFEKADQNAPSAAALELAMRARERAEQLDRAATLAELALVRYPDNADLQTSAQALVDRAERELHKVSVTCDTPCDLVVGTKIIAGPAATERIVYLPPGEHVMKAGWAEGRTQSQKITATEAGTSEVQFTEPPASAEPAASGEDDPADDAVETDASLDAGTPVKAKGGWSPAVFWVGVGLTAVAGGVTAWSGIDTINSPGADAVRERCIDESCPEYQEGRDKQTRTNILAGVTAGVGVATILVGVLATDWSGGKASKALAVPRQRSAGSRLGIEPWVTIGQGATVGASGRF